MLFKYRENTLGYSLQRYVHFHGIKKNILNYDLLLYTRWLKARKTLGNLILELLIWLER